MYRLTLLTTLSALRPGLVAQASDLRLRLPSSRRRYPVRRPSTRRIGALVLATLSLLAPVCPGAESADSASRPLPTAFFRKLQAGGKQTAVVYGTSLSHTAEWPKALDAWLTKEFPGQVTFVNAASSGKESNWGLASLPQRVLPHHPDLVFLEFSMNDSATKHQISQQQALANLDSMVKRLRVENPEVEVVLQVMNPVFNGNDGKASADARPELEAYYDDYRRYAKANDIPLIDHYPAWDELRRRDPGKYRRWMPDGTHPIPEASLAVTWRNIRTFLEDARAAAGRLPASPTLGNVPYGDHPRQKLDFWQASSDHSTPVLVYLHGGGWGHGDKRDVRKHNFGELLSAGISVVSMNYRYVFQAIEEGVEPPVSWPMQDAARVVQFVRSKAGEWNLDKSRIGLSGTSAGACSGLWLAFHDDLAEPDSDDPVARESTRVSCAAVYVAQTSLDPEQMMDWTPNSRYGGHAFGVTDPKALQFQRFLERRDELLPWIREYSPYEHASAGDPPTFLIYDTPPNLGHEEKDPTHSANFGVMLKEKLDRIGVPCKLVYPGAPDVKHASIEDYLIEKLTP